MKKNKIIGIGVATLGAIFSIGGAFALYQKGVANVGFGIGAATYTSSNGAVTYEINNTTAPTVSPSYLRTNGTNDGSKLDEEYRHVKYEFLLGASYATGLTAQDFVVGTLRVTFNGVVASLQGKIDVSMYFTGYTADSIGAVTYGSNLTSGGTAIDKTSVTAAALTVDSRDIAVASSGVQTLVVYIRLDSSVDTLAMDEASNLWNLSVTWDKPSDDFAAAYVANTACLWSEDDEYVMAPNINRANSSGWEWTAQVTGSSTLTEAKCKMGDAWAGGDNAQLNDGTTYDFYWSGVNGANQSVNVHS